MLLTSLRINADSKEIKNSISSILELEANMPFKHSFWGFEINDEESDIVHPIDFFYGKLIHKLNDLKALGITNDNITIWELYEYDQQCNLEYDSETIGKLNALGVTLCISCWQK